VDFADALHKEFVVLLAEKYFLSSAPTVHDVIDSSGILDTKWPSHDNRHYYSKSLTVNKRFDPFDLRLVPVATVRGAFLIAKTTI
jgi:hypothetical protein